METYNEEPEETDEDNEIDFKSSGQMGKIGAYLALVCAVIVLIGGVYLTLDDSVSIGRSPARSIVPDSGTRFVSGPILFTIGGGMLCAFFGYWISEYFVQRKKNKQADSKK